MKLICIWIGIFFTLTLLYMACCDDMETSACDGKGSMAYCMKLGKE